jgi:hypothetical protein
MSRTATPATIASLTESEVNEACPETGHRPVVVAATNKDLLCALIERKADVNLLSEKGNHLRESALLVRH